jgi:uncharacterized protein (TIGR02246 family)
MRAVQPGPMAPMAGPGGEAGLGFAEALRAHLDAIAVRDLEALASTVAPDEVVLISAAGEVTTSAQHFLALHRDWFASRTWSLQTRLVHQRVGDGFARCVLELDYRDTAPDGTPVRIPSILTLLFERRGGRWLMVQDQNTPITG